MKDYKHAVENLESALKLDSQNKEIAKKLTSL